MIGHRIFGLLCILIAVQYTMGAAFDNQFSPISAGLLPASLLPGAQPTICKAFLSVMNGTHTKGCDSPDPIKAAAHCDFKCQCVHGAFSGKCAAFPTGFIPEPEPSGATPQMCDCNYKDPRPQDLPAANCVKEFIQAYLSQICSSLEVTTGSNKCALHCYCRHAKVYGGACSEVNGFCKCKDSW